VNDDALALAFRTGLPFVGLRDREHDPAIDDVVPPAAAAAAGVVALAATDDHVRLAVAHPSVDLSALEPYVGDRRVELAIASRAELEAIVGPPPPVVEEPVAGDEPLTKEEPEPKVGPEPEAEVVAEPAAVAEPAVVPVAVYEADPVPAGAEPSWLEPPARWRRTLRVLLYLTMLLIVAAGAVLAYLLTR
jgi:hypothetical protein